MATAQKFDTLDGLVVTGTLETGGLSSSGNLTVDTNVLYVDTATNRVGINKTPTVALDVSGAVSITSGNITGLANLGAGNLSINTDTITGTAGITLDAVGDISLDADGADILLKDAGTQYGALTNSSGNLVIKSGSTTALTFAAADVTFGGSTTYANGEKIDFGSVMDITASASGATFSANTYHSGHLVHTTSDTDTHIKFNNNQIVLTAGASAALTATSTLTSAAVELTAPVIRASDYFIETKVAATSGTGTKTYNLNTGSSFDHSASGNFTASFTNIPTTNTTSWTLRVNNNGTARSITWSATKAGGAATTINWAEGVDPPESTGVDIYSFMSIDGVVYGSLAIRNAF